jgi:hypothetical protein
MQIGIGIGVTYGHGGAPKTAGSLSAQIGFSMMLMPMSMQSNLALLMGDMVSDAGQYDREKFPPSQKGALSLLIRADSFGL